MGVGIKADSAGFLAERVGQGARYLSQPPSPIQTRVLNIGLVYNILEGTISSYNSSSGVLEEGGTEGSMSLRHDDVFSPTPFSCPTSRITVEVPHSRTA